MGRHVTESTNAPHVLISHLWGGKSQGEPTKGRVVNKQERVYGMPLAVAVSDKRKLARNQLEKAPNRAVQNKASWKRQLSRPRETA